MSEAGRWDEAGPLWQRIDTTLDAAIADGHRRLRLTKAATLHNRAILASTSAERLAMAEAAVTILRELVDDQGQYQLAAELADAQFRAAYENELLGRPRPALEGYRAARRAYEQAVLRDGRTDLADKLARAYDFESTLVGADAPDEPVRLAEQAVAVWTRLTEADGRPVWQGQLSDATRKLSHARRQAGDLAGARDAAERALALVDGSTGEVSARDDFPRLLAEVELAVVERAEGDPMAAVQRLRDALARADRLPRSGELRPTILLRLGHALSDLQSFEAAADAYEEAARAAEGSLDRRTRMVGTLEAQHGRINVLMRFGEHELVVDEATALLERYAGLIAEGRDDLAGEQARLRGLLGHVLFLTGDLPAAATALEEAGAELTARSDDTARSAGEVLTGKAANTRALLAIGDEQVPGFLADLRDRYEQLRQLSLAGDVASAACLLEEDMAAALAVAERHFSPDLIEFCGELGIGVGLMSGYAHRDAAAIRSFDIAGQCYLALYDNVRPRPDHLDRWCDTRIGQATVYAVRGDGERLHALLEDVTTAVTSRDPQGSPARVARVRQAVEQMILKYGRTG